MPSKYESKKYVDLHATALKQFDGIYEAQCSERDQSLEDRRFYSIAGAQWEGSLESQFENKPKFEVNKIHLAVIRIINEYRNNRITVDFVSRDGQDDDSLANMCDGLYRADEKRSVAEEAYDNAFEEAVGGGFGAWRLRAEYEDEEDPENDRQRICIEPIFDADTSVYFDPQAKRQDKSDAKYAFIITSMTYESFEEEYGEDPSSWPKETFEDYNFDWCSPEVVYVAEYFKIEEVKENVHVWKLLDGEEVRLSDEELENQYDYLTNTKAEEVRTKKVIKKKVRKYIMSGNKVLEDCGYIAGKCIPIIPVYGKRWYIDNIERCMGHVRLAKDAQRLKNMQLSKLGEISALGSVEKPIFTAEQVAGHQEMWADDNIKNYPYLLLNPITDANGNITPAGPIAYTKTATIPQALAALLQITEDDINDLLGNSQQGEKIEGGISTETAELITNRLDMQTFIYLSNFAKAVKRSGEIWLSMAKDIFVEEGRKLKTLSKQGESENIELLKPELNGAGETVLANDISQAKFDVWVEVGPSSSTKKSATVRALSNMMKLTADPETQQVLSSMIMLNMEGEGVGDVRAYFRNKLVRMGVVQPTEQEKAQIAAEAQNAKPSAQDEYFQAAAEKERAEAGERASNTILKQAQADKTRAEVVEILNGLETDKAKLVLDFINQLGPRVEPQSSQGVPIQEQSPV